MSETKQRYDSEFKKNVVNQPGDHVNLKVGKAFVDKAVKVDRTSLYLSFA
ncbi:MAG: hypothetical protein WBI44_00035 [Syntrophaceticus sp.]